MDAVRESVGGFAAGTSVHTKDGPRPIEQVRVGDWVLTYRDDQIPPQRLREKAEYAYRQVTGASWRDDEPVCVVVAWDLGNNVKEEIRVAPRQSLYVKSGGWTQAGSVKFGNALVSAEFANLLVKKRLGLAERLRVYAIEVEGCCSYYVGELGTWAHGG